MSTEENKEEQAEATTQEAPEVETLDPADFVESEETTEGDAPEEPSAEEQLAEEKDRNLRLQAELQNILTRKSREVADERKYGALSFIRDLLPAIDNIDRALEAAGKEEDSNGGLTEGFRLVRQQLITLLEQHECKLIETTDADFDPELHEAILQQPSPDHESGKIMMVTQTGYRLHDRVVRPAQVIVSSGPAE